MKTFGSFFSGGGLADVGAMAAGFTPVFAVENDPGNVKQSMRIADCYDRNIGAHSIRRPVQCVNWHELPRVDWFHASPVCKNFSNAKLDRSESDVDIITADATCSYIYHHKPQYVTIENVRAYIKSAAWQMIADCLDVCGYGWRVANENAADYGVPQTRIRMFCRAVLNGKPPEPLVKTHSKKPKPATLFEPAPLPWVGWYESVADLAHTFPDDKFAPWQVKKLTEAGFEFGDSILMNAANPNGNEKNKWRFGEQPSKTLTAGDCGAIKSFVVSGASTADIRTGNQPALTNVSSESNMMSQRVFLAEGSTPGGRPIQYKGIEAPSMTLTTPSGGNVYKMFCVHGAANKHGETLTVRDGLSPHTTMAATYHKHEVRAYIGRVCRITPRGLARFMSLPDWYELPERKTDATTLLGNGVCCLLMQRIGEAWI